MSLPIFHRPSIRALLFLTVRQLVNGAKRALGHPVRIIGLLFFLGSYGMLMIRPLFASRSRIPADTLNQLPKIDFPPIAVVEAIVFACLAVISFVLMASSNVQPQAFKPADVDVLFPTPVNSCTILVFRIVRDYFLSLVMPLLVMAFGAYGLWEGWQLLFRGMPNPAYAGMALRALISGYFLMAMAWVSIGYAASLTINRSDLLSDRNKRLLSWGSFLLFSAVCAFAYLQLRDNLTVNGWIDLLYTVPIRTYFFTASFATELGLAPLKGDWVRGAIGLGGLLALVVIPVRIALRNVGWMYDQAAARGHAMASSAVIRDATRKGDFTAIFAERARTGKIRRSGLSWAYRVNLPRSFALIWKEPFLQLRGSIGFHFICLVAFGLSTWLVLAVDDRVQIRSVLLFVCFVSSGFLAVSFIGQMGAIDLLRKVDFIKPLPYSLTKVLLVDVASRTLLATLMTILACLVVVAGSPRLAGAAFGCMLLGPSVLLLFNAEVYFSSVVFPDFDDMTQKQIRGLVMLLAMAVTMIPLIGLFIGLWVAGVPVFLNSLLVSALCFAVAAAFCFVSARLYANYNPSE